jgi:hypothetical protein
MNTFRVLASAAALLSFASPAGAVGRSQDSTVTLNAALVEINPPGAGALEGALVLRISPDGIVEGTYRPVDSGSLRNVTGGLTGNQIWLDIGDSRVIHIEGTYENGKIVGYTYFDGPHVGIDRGPREYRFEATPAATPET